MFKTPTFNPCGLTRKRARSLHDIGLVDVINPLVFSSSVTPFAEKEIQQILNNEKGMGFCLHDVKWTYEDDVDFGHCAAPPPTM
ncbi:hypothetical protein QTN25_008604 [Entamoeba marina]